MTVGWPAIGVALCACVGLLGPSSTSPSHGQTLACQGSQKPQQVVDLLFGRKIGDQGAVSEGAWRRFVAREITPRFPDGLTILDGRGQWLDQSTKRVMREPSNVVMIALPGNPDDHERLNQIAEAYKRLFRQQSVGIIIRSACVSF